MFWGHQLPFTNRMHDFYTGDRTASRPKGLEPEHGTGEAFHGAMVLLYEIIEVFTVPNDNGGLVRLVVVRNRCRVAPTLIDGDFLRQSLTANSFV